MGQDIQYKRQRLLKHYTRLYTLSQVWGLFLKPHIRVWNLPRVPILLSPALQMLPLLDSQ